MTHTPMANTKPQKQNRKDLGNKEAIEMGKFKNLTSDFCILLKEHVLENKIGLYKIHKTFKKLKVDTTKQAKIQKQAIKNTVAQINDAFSFFFICVLFFTYIECICTNTNKIIVSKLNNTHTET